MSDTMREALERWALADLDSRAQRVAVQQEIRALLALLSARAAATTEPEGGGHKPGESLKPVLGPLRLECERACLFHCPTNEDPQPPADVRERVARAYFTTLFPNLTLEQMTDEIRERHLNAADAALRAVRGRE